MMKKSTFAIKSLIALVAAGMISCSGSDKETATVTKAACSDSTACVGLNIRYVDIDSVMAAYNLSKELGEQGRKLMLDYQRMENQKRNEIQNLGAAIEQKRNNNGYLTQESFESDVNSFNRKQSEASNILGAQQEKVNKQLAEFDRQLNDSVKNFIEDYNAIHHYDAILYRASGLYFNPALDITDEIIEGLNARYVPAAEKK